MTSRYQRTTAVIREQGYLYAKTEKWNHFAKIKTDLFNIFDLVVLKPFIGIVGVQVCGSDYKSHERKILVEESKNTRAWLDSFGLIEIHAWAKRKKKRGGKAMVWVCRIFDIKVINGELKAIQRQKKK